MKVCFFLLVSAISLLSFGQDTLDLPLKKSIKTIKYNCKNATVADVCKTRIFSTHQPELFYKINYDAQGRIHSQGAVIKEGLEPAESYQKHETEYFEVGIWRYYNYEQTEIVYYRCIYSSKPGCSVLSKEEMKKEKIQ
ncbi:MAG: hypothetical protein SH857_06915 [Chitinophagales bacterium]|nr:hypothetical protein [Chitinophagales bacterium]